MLPSSLEVTKHIRELPEVQDNAFSLMGTHRQASHQKAESWRAESEDHCQLQARQMFPHLRPRTPCNTSFMHIEVSQVGFEGDQLVCSCPDRQALGLGRTSASVEGCLLHSWSPWIGVSRRCSLHSAPVLALLWQLGTRLMHLVIEPTYQNRRSALSSLSPPIEACIKWLKWFNSTKAEGPVRSQKYTRRRCYLETGSFTDIKILDRACTLRFCQPVHHHHLNLLLCKVLTSS